jgi:hypothetical protein
MRRYCGPSTVVAAVAIFYIWTSRPDHRRQEAVGNQRHRPFEIHRELAHQHTVMLTRCAELQRMLDEHRRSHLCGTGTVSLLEYVPKGRLPAPFYLVESTHS